MKIYLGGDHAAFPLKEKIKEYLTRDLGYETEDKGALNFDGLDDYPDFIKPVARAVASDPERSLGIIMGGSGQGEAMVANRFKGVRATVYYGGPEEIIKLSREHNDANILSIGARFVSENDILQAIKLWLNTPFSGEERHTRRIAKIDEDR